MGLRFRKTISILPGVRLNLGKSSASVSVGVPGFRKTFNTKGQVTTSVGLPGTGLYYVDQKNPKKEKEKRQREQEKQLREAASSRSQEAKTASERVARAKAAVPAREFERTAPRTVPMTNLRSSASYSRVDAENLLRIHKSVDDSIDWAEVLASPEPPDEGYNPEMWGYYHSVAAAVLDGDIDTYLSVIYEVNPLDDLMEYGGGFTFGTDDPKKMEVEFDVNESALFGLKASVNQAEYNNILQDFICSTAIRIARDIFALLPVEETIVHAQLRNRTVLSAAFDRATLQKIRFGFIDPSDTMTKFRFNMDFDLASGFGEVERIE